MYCTADVLWYFGKNLNLKRIELIMVLLQPKKVSSLRTIAVWAAIDKEVCVCVSQ